MTDETPKPAKTILDPFDRLVEVVCGILMVITFTGTLSVTQAGNDNVHAMLVGAIGCNLAWGIVDAIMYLMACVAQNTQNRATIRSILDADDPAIAQQRIADALPPAVAAVLGPEELATMYRRLQALPEPPIPANLSKDEWLAAIGVFFLVFVTTFPLVIPFVVVEDATTAVRCSHAIAFVMLFVAGFAYGVRSGHRPWRTGFFMALVGAILAVVTVILGG